MSTLVFRVLLGVCLSAGSLVLAVPLKAAEAPMTVTDPALFILFLGQHAQDANRRANHVHGPNDASMATRLRVKPEELTLIDQKALAYVTEDQKIHEEALQYRDACIRAHQPLDPVVVHSLTTRRIAQAASAFSDIHSGLSATSYAGFEQYLTSVVMKSFKRQPVR